MVEMNLIDLKETISYELSIIERRCDHGWVEHLSVAGLNLSAWPDLNFQHGQAEHFSKGRLNL